MRRFMMNLKGFSLKPGLNLTKNIFCKYFLFNPSGCGFRYPRNPRVATRGYSDLALSGLALQGHGVL